MSLPIIAIVGLPNAGKSTLLNKIAGTHTAVTSEVPGTTRDRQYLDTAWDGREFTLVDTAGIDHSLLFSPSGRDALPGARQGGSAKVDNIKELDSAIHEQIEIAAKEADILLFVIDGKTDPGSIPRDVLLKFRKSKKPVVLAVNKLDSAPKAAATLASFQRLGVKPAFGISSVTGRGIGDLLDSLVSILPEPLSPTPFSSDIASAKLEALSPDNRIAVAIVGKPNVGKSSLFNKILKEDRVVVSNVPGTTRTSIDSHIKMGDTDYTFIDTAGLKKKEHRQSKPDIFSGFQTYKSIRRSDVCFFVIDSTEEITKQDQAIAQEIFSQDKGCIILVTKIDAFVSSPGRQSSAASRAGKKLNDGREKMQSTSTRGSTDDQYRTLKDYVSHHFPFLWMSPVFFVSGKTGEGLEEALATIEPIYQRRHKVVDEDKLKLLLGKWMKKNPPKLLRDQKAPKVYGLKQLLTNPPLFELTVNSPGAISTQFRKSIQNAIIKELGFWGTPVNLTLRKKV